MGKNSKRKQVKNSSKMQNRSIIVVSLIVLVALFFGGSYYYKNNQMEKSMTLAKEESILLQRPHSFVMGDENAKVQLVEFFDPACGTCAQFHPYVKDIMKKYKGDVKLVMRYAPFHQNANYVIKMLHGAKEQGKFMETLEYVFNTQHRWVINHMVDPNALWRLLPNVTGLDMEKLTQYMKDPKGDEVIKQDLEDAQKLGITKTPGYIVNGKPLQNFGLDNLIKLIESEL